MWKIVVITISDRSYNGQREDITGPQLTAYLKERNHCVEYNIVPDEMEMIKKELIKFSKSEKSNLILTCGGTGFAKRDITPEATREVIEKEASGIMEFMRSENAKTNSRSYLSRGICGIIGESIVINLPGSPEGALSSFKIIEPLLEHCVDILTGKINDCKNF